MSDMLTHWATFDDCRRLAQIDPKIHPDFREVMEIGAEQARLGTLTRGGSVWMEPTLRNARDSWDQPEARERNQRNVAFVLGGLIHQACDRVMKPILTDAGGSDWSEIMAAMQGPRAVQEARKDDIARTQEASAYFDAEVFRQVYLEGREKPFSRYFMADASPDDEAFEQVIQAMFQRTILSSHTLKPDSEHMEQWLDNLFEKVQHLPVKVSRWLHVYNHGDPRKAEELGIKTRFYRADDPSILAARLLQAGREPDEELKRRVFQDGESACAYGDVIQTGLYYLRSASAFWNGEVQTFAAPNYIKNQAA
ncbi:MAG: hypothetical protein MEP57_09015 [Microvirga sp.]|nr:hypothetical protein [Microvirga sp.]